MGPRLFTSWLAPRRRGRAFTAAELELPGKPASKPPPTAKSRARPSQMKPGSAPTSPRCRRRGEAGLAARLDDCADRPPTDEVVTQAPTPVPRVLETHPAENGALSGQVRLAGEAARRGDEALAASEGRSRQLATVIAGEGRRPRLRSDPGLLVPGPRPASRPSASKTRARRRRPPELVELMPAAAWLAALEESSLRRRQ